MIKSGKQKMFCIQVGVEHPSLEHDDWLLWFLFAGIWACSRCTCKFYKSVNLLIRYFRVYDIIGSPP